MYLIEAERRARRWSQTVLAAHAGKLSQADISKFERGRAVPRPSQAERLSRVLGVSPDSLMRKVREPGAPAPVDVEAIRG